LTFPKNSDKIIPMKEHTGFLIDAKTQSITPVLVGDFRHIQKLIGCDLFCIGAYVNDDGDTLFVDDEGLLNGTEHCFLFDGRLLMGNGLVVGCNENTGNSRDARIELTELVKRVKFPPSCFRLSDEARDKMCQITVTSW